MYEWFLAIPIHIDIPIVTSVAVLYIIIYYYTIGEYHLLETLTLLLIEYIVRIALVTYYIIVIVGGEELAVLYIVGI